MMHNWALSSHICPLASPEYHGLGARVGMPSTPSDHRKEAPMQGSPVVRTFADLREVLESRFEIPADSVTLETPLEKLGLDSLELVELGLLMEIDIDPNDFSAGTTIGEMAGLMAGADGTTLTATSTKADRTA
ncbi:hypothetical protein CTZ27_03675 [Streptomyces griseocarneus]|nr:hypothetical protein CTZ27_03675 [Streptomyces griseocarneus]